MKFLKKEILRNLDFKGLVLKRQELSKSRENLILNNELKAILGQQEYKIERITTNSSTNLLEKIIKYENVHEIRDLNELYSRLNQGRRIYRIFHENWKEEPLVFTEIALMNNIATSMNQIFQNHSLKDPKVVVFYSINSTQPGLSGLGLGEMMIKGVSKDLATEFKSLKTFCTLSPIVGFVDWLKQDPKFRNSLKSPLDKETLLSKCKEYILHTKKEKYAMDPVTNFHVRNGAEFYQINWNADTSKKGIEKSFGLMANYIYPMDRLEENSRNYIDTGIVNEFPRQKI